MESVPVARCMTLRARIDAAEQWVGVLGVQPRSDPSVAREGFGPEEVFLNFTDRGIRWCTRAASSQVGEGGTRGDADIPTQRPPESSVAVIARASVASLGEQRTRLEEP